MRTNNVDRSRTTESRSKHKLLEQARKLCEAEPGYGTGFYRGDPYEAVLLQQEADAL
jgi:hypothetical protein